MPYIVFCNYIRIAFLIRYALRFMISCLLGMCSFIQGALCFIFSYPFGMLSPIRCIICFTLSGQPVMCSFVLCVSCFTLSCPLALLFHPIFISFILSCPLRLCPLNPCVLCVILSLAIRIPFSIRCVI